MATTSYLYHALGLKGYVHQRTDYRGGGVFHHVELAPHKRRCRNCSARWNRLQLPASRSPDPPPVRCFQRSIRTRRYTNSFAQYVVQLCRIATIKAVARLLGVGWDLVKEIHKEHLGQRLKKRKLSQLRYLAIDGAHVKRCVNRLRRLSPSTPG